MHEAACWGHGMYGRGVLCCTVHVSSVVNKIFLHFVQALEAQKTASMKRCYYDLSDMLATNPSGNVPYTPSIPLLYGLRESLGLLKAEGIDNVIARHHRCAVGPSSLSLRLGCVGVAYCDVWAFLARTSFLSAPSTTLSYV